MSDASTPARPRRSIWQFFFGLVSLLNLLFLLVILLGFASLIFLGIFGPTPGDHLDETFHSGKTSSKHKIAVVHVEGVIMDGMTGFARKQLEQASKDDHVKAVVLRVNSPGGSITASDELHRLITELAQGTSERDGKPVVVSMGALAASGGYYIAMPAKKLYAERTTLTGSIGVFASFPNIRKLCDDVGVKMEVIKRGAVKDSGSPFKDMTAPERQLWQEMVDHAYDQFLEVVRQGRPDIAGKLTEVVIDRPLTVRDEKVIQEKEERYIRTRVDGGIFTADQAKEFGLIDQIGYLEDAIKDAAITAGLGSDYRAVSYDRPQTLAERLLGVQGPRPTLALDPARLAEAATPRLWYLAPQSELAGILTAAGK